MINDLENEHAFYAFLAWFSALVGVTGHEY